MSWTLEMRAGSAEIALSNEHPDGEDERRFLLEVATPWGYANAVLDRTGLQAIRDMIHEALRGAKNADAQE